MFTISELALLNRAYVADAKASRVIDMYRQMVVDLREELRPSTRRETFPSIKLVALSASFCSPMFSLDLPNQRVTRSGRLVINVKDLIAT